MSGATIDRFRSDKFRRKHAGSVPRFNRTLRYVNIVRVIPATFSLPTMCPAAERSTVRKLSNGPSTEARIQFGYQSEFELAGGSKPASFQTERFSGAAINFTKADAAFCAALSVVVAAP